MTTVITERDKKLLLLVSCALILVVCVQYLIRPAQAKQEELELRLEELEIQQMEWEMQLRILDTIDATIEKNTQARDEASIPYRDRLDTRQMDEMITNLALKVGLFPQQLQLTAPEPGVVKDYPYYTPETGRTLVPQGYVHVGTARLEVQGEVAQWERFMDTVSKSMPNLRITQFEVDTQSVWTEEEGIRWVHVIRSTMEIYMCIPGEEAA